MGMKRILALILLVCFSTPSEARYVRAVKSGLDKTGVEVSADVTLVCTSGQTLATTGSGTWACGSGIVSSKAFTITAVTAAGDFGNVWKVPSGITLTAIHCLAVGGTNVVGQLQECDGNGVNCADVDSDMTCTAATNVNDDGSLTNPSIDSGDYIGVKTTSVSGTNTNITWTFEYTRP